MIHVILYSHGQFRIAVAVGLGPIRRQDIGNFMITEVDRRIQHTVQEYLNVFLETAVCLNNGCTMFSYLRGMIIKI